MYSPGEKSSVEGERGGRVPGEIENKSCEHLVKHARKSTKDWRKVAIGVVKFIKGKFREDDEADEK